MVSLSRWPPTYGQTTPATVMRPPTTANDGLPPTRPSDSVIRPATVPGAEGRAAAAPAGAHRSARPIDASAWRRNRIAMILCARAAEQDPGAGQAETLCERHQQSDRKQRSRQQQRYLPAPVLERREGDRVVDRVGGDAGVERPGVAVQQAQAEPQRRERHQIEG